MVVVGYITAVIMPIIGLVLGIVAVTRPDPSVTRHGAWIIGLSALMFVIYVFLLLAVGADTQPVLGGN